MTRDEQRRLAQKVLDRSGIDRLGDSGELMALAHAMIVVLDKLDAIEEASGPLRKIVCSADLYALLTEIDGKTL